MPVVIAALISLGVMFLISLFSLCVLSSLWTWYITPVFHIAVPELHYLYGLSLIVAYFSSSSAKGKSVSDLLAESLTKSIVILSLGWLVHVIF